MGNKNGTTARKSTTAGGENSDVGGKLRFVEYVWLGGNPNMFADIRSKTKALKPGDEIDLWNYDGSSTNQASGGDSEVILRPVKIYPDPFRNPETDLLVLCENLKWNQETADLQPTPCNERHKCEKIMNAAEDQKPRFGIEQELFILDNETLLPLGFSYDEDDKQGNFYCATDGQYVSPKLRMVYDDVLEACRVAGLNITGGNLEVAPGQIEFQVDSYGVDCGDDLWMLRYLIDRVTQKYNCYADFNTRIVDGDWNGSGCHTNFSVADMMKEGGLKYIEGTILPRLKEKHFYHMERYGEGNCDRLSGKHETGSWKNFSYGVGSREDSIRIPVITAHNKKGYIEDRRPASSMNPYKVTSLLVQTALGVCPEVEFGKDMLLERGEDGQPLSEQPPMKRRKYRTMITGERLSRPGNTAGGAEESVQPNVPAPKKKRFLAF